MRDNFKELLMEFNRQAEPMRLLLSPEIIQWIEGYSAFWRPTEGEEAAAMTFNEKLTAILLEAICERQANLIDSEADLEALPPTIARACRLSRRPKAVHDDGIPF